MSYAFGAARFLKFLNVHPKLLNRIGGSVLIGASTFMALVKDAR